MDGEYRQKINLELTESEADCLLSWILSMVRMSGNSLEQEQSTMTIMLFARLVEAFPTLMESENVMLFREQNGHESERVPTDKALVVRDRVLKQVKQDLQAIRSRINAELAKLNEREKLVESRCIKRILQDDWKYPTERMRLAEIGRRLGADVDYQIIKEKKHNLKSELSKISAEISALPKTPRANPQKLPLPITLQGYRTSSNVVLTL